MAKRCGWLCFHAATLAVVLLTACGQLARLAWLFELSSHFRVQYGAWLVFASLVYLVSRRGKVALATCVVAAINLWPVMMSGGRFDAPYGLSRRPAPSAGDARPWRILSANLWAENPQHEPALQLVRAANPDVAIFVEVGFPWAEALRSLDYSYPYRRVVPADHGFGLAIFSRLPMSEVVVTTIGQPEKSLVIVARVALSGRPLTVIGAHPYSPRRPGRLASRNRQLQDLAALVKRETNPVIVIGDLNVTPWSPYFSDFLTATRLSDTRRGFGLQATWPTWCPPLGIPIDHCLTPPELDVRQRMVGPNIGSDHLPILVDVSWRE